MFANVGWGEVLVLIVVGLVVLGPERLPGAIRWATTSLRQARDYLSGMTTQLREDMGPEFDDIDWRKLDPRQYDPRRIVREALSDTWEDGDPLGLRTKNGDPLGGLRMPSSGCSSF